MHHRMAVGRREFSLQTALALLSGVTVTISGCGSGYGTDSASGSATGPSSAAGDIPGSVADNHGHAAVITGAQVVAGGGVRLDIRGMADHPHTVDLTAAELTAVIGGEAMAKRSSAGQSTLYSPHDHMVTFRGRSDDVGGY